RRLSMSSPPSSSSFACPYPPFKAGLIQLNSQEDYDLNYLRCAALIRRAVSLGAQIVFTPDNTTRLTSLTLPFSVSSAHYEADHLILPQFRLLARELKVWI